jgi:DNA-binding NtrC family response regulator
MRGVVSDVAQNRQRIFAARVGIFCAGRKFQRGYRARAPRDGKLPVAREACVHAACAAVAKKSARPAARKLSRARRAKKSALLPRGDDLRSALDDAEKRILEHALAHCGGNRERAAKALGINRSTLFAKLRRHGVR